MVDDTGWSIMPRIGRNRQTAGLTKSGIGWSRLLVTARLVGAGTAGDGHSRPTSSLDLT